MTIQVEAIFEGGVLQPLEKLNLSEGQRVRLAIETQDGQNGATIAALPSWCNVYEGLSPTEIEEVEAIALDRSNFMRPANQE